MPERMGAALLHWINPVDVRPLYYAGSVTTPHDVDAFSALASAARAKTVAAVGLAGAAGVQPLPRGLAAREAAVRGSEQFRTAYEPLGAEFVSVPVADLITPQWWADTSYVGELEAAVPSVGDDQGLFNFCFAEGRLEPPMVLGMNGAVIVSGRRSLGALSPLRLRFADQSKATFEFDAMPRPNYVWLNMIPGTNQIVVLNGVHHLLALIHAGRERAYCLIRQGPLEQVINLLGDPGFIKLEHLTSERPPLVRDFLDGGVSDAVAIRAMDQFMRFGVQMPPEIGMVPQSE